MTKLDVVKKLEAISEEIHKFPSTWKSRSDYTNFLDQIRMQIDFLSDEVATQLSEEWNNLSE